MRPPLSLSRRDLNSLFSPEPPVIGLGRAPLLAPALFPGAEDTWLLILHLWPCSSVPPSTCLMALHLCLPPAFPLPSLSFPPPDSRYPILCAPPRSPLTPLLPVLWSLLWPDSWSPICTSLDSSFFSVFLSLSPPLGTPFVRSSIHNPISGSHYRCHPYLGTQTCPSLTLSVPHSLLAFSLARPQPCPTTWPRSRRPARPWNS